MSATALGAIGNLGADLSFSVAFSIAAELVAAAKEGQMSEDELIASVLILSIVLTALPRTLGMVVKELRSFGWLHETTPPGSSAAESGLLEFSKLLIDIARRISVSLSVQLLAANVRVKQPDRGVRVVSLLSVAVFFRARPPVPQHAPTRADARVGQSVCATVFLEASSSIGLKVHKAS